jgi:hypothetical protein
MPILTLFRRPSRPAPVRRARLFLESLDGRICPDGNDPTNPGSGSQYITPPPVDNPPVIINFAAENLSSGLVCISGTVVDEHPGGLTVHFSGAQQAINGQTVTTHTDGTFSLTVTLHTDGSDDGTVSAQTADAAGHPSNVVYVDVHPR